MLKMPKSIIEQELKDKLKEEYQKGIKDGAEGIKAQLEMWKISKLKKAEKRIEK